MLFIHLIHLILCLYTISTRLDSTQHNSTQNRSSYRHIQSANMQITKTLIAALFAASTAVAAPTPADKSMMAAVPEWTITNLKRVCNAGNTSCTWTFAVDTHLATATSCTYVVKATANASQASGGPVTCGPYTVTSSWSGQFGPNNGFTTLAVTNVSQKLIVWPAYTDVQVQAGNVVTPNLSYAPATLP